MSKFRSKAPLRMGLAGGGTDVSPYSDMYGGNILNACLELFAYATITPRTDNKIVFIAHDRGDYEECEALSELPTEGRFELMKGTYNRIVKDFFDGNPLSFTLETHVDAPAGSGLGSSSTLVVAVIKTFAEWLDLPLGEYDIAHLAYEIERLDLNQAGGKQDHYAATFGGINFMEFYKEDKVIVNPLKIRDDYVQELQLNLVLYYTGTSRLSSKIIEAQVQNVVDSNQQSIEAMHELKHQAQMMKKALFQGDIDAIGEILDFGWQNKKKMAKDISNPLIDYIYESAIAKGASGGKLSGAGGGGFMFFYCPNNARFDVIKKLNEFGGKTMDVIFSQQGATSWRVQ